MTIYDFCGLCLEPKFHQVKIWDGSPDCVAKDNIVFRGSFEDASLSEYNQYEVASFEFDFDTKEMTINIYSNEE